MFCSKCGTQLDASAEFCSRCGTPNAGSSTSTLPANLRAVSQPQVIVVRPGKNAGLAAVLSFFWCGLGQIYNGQIGKGILFGIFYFISFLLMFVAIGFLTTPLLWIWGMVDAYRTSEAINQRAGTL